MALAPAHLSPDHLARLLGISKSSVLRYTRGERDTPDEVAARLHRLAIIVGYLNGSYNALGVRRWFARPRTALDGTSPDHRIDAPARASAERGA